jgi:heme oxygenase
VGRAVFLVRFYRQGVGKTGVDAYARYTEQLWFVYEALETGAERLASDPVAGPFIQGELFRLPALERDHGHLRGADWRSGLTALPATRAYADRVRECAESWPAGYIAHHYTRYLGDLSGGQIIRDKAERTWGFARRGDGVRFYVFEGIGNPAAFKRDTGSGWIPCGSMIWRSSGSWLSASGRSR